MKILITPQGGGTNPYVPKLTAALQAAGATVALVPSGRFAFWRAVRTHGKPDVIHLQWHHHFFTAPTLPHAALRTLAFFVQLTVLAWLGVGIVWTVHESLNFAKHQSRWQLWYSRRLARLATQIVVHCETTKAPVADLFGVDCRRLRVVELGSYGEGMPPAPTQAQARAALGMAADEHIMLFFGHIRPYKGLTNLVTAFAQLPALHARLFIVGKPRHNAALDTLIQQATQDARVTLDLRYVPDAQLVAYIAAADVVVLPYLETMTSSALNLAAALGRPAIVPKLGCMAAFPADAALFYDPHCGDGLPLALAASLTAPLRQMGACARRHVARRSWAHVAADTLAIYRACLGLGSAESTPHTPHSA